MGILCLQLYPIGHVQQLLQVQCPSSVLVLYIFYLSIEKYIYIYQLDKSWQQIPEGGFFSVGEQKKMQLLSAHFSLRILLDPPDGRGVFSNLSDNGGVFYRFFGPQDRHPHKLRGFFGFL